MQGTLVSVENRPLGSELVSAADIGDRVLAVDFAADFDTVNGGSLLLNGATLAYTSADPDAETITLAAPLATAAAVNDFAQTIEAGVPAVEWIANVSVDDGDAVAAVIPTPLIPYFPAGSYDDPLTVSIEWDTPNDEYRVTSQPNKAPSFDGISIWNPHSLRQIAAQSIPAQTGSDYTTVTNWTDIDTDGVTVDSDYTVVYPGFYTITFHIGFNFAADGRRRVRVLGNGNTGDPLFVTSEAPDPVSAFSSFVDGTFYAQLDQGDVLTLQVQQTSSTDPLPLNIGRGRGTFTMIRSSI